MKATNKFKSKVEKSIYGEMEIGEKLPLLSDGIPIGVCTIVDADDKFIYIECYRTDFNGGT